MSTVLSFREYKCSIHGYGWIPDDDSISEVMNPLENVKRCAECSNVVKTWMKDYPIHKGKIKINVLNDPEKQNAKCGKYAKEEWEKTLDHWKKQTQTTTVTRGTPA